MCKCCKLMYKFICRMIQISYVGQEPEEGSGHLPYLSLLHWQSSLNYIVLLNNKKKIKLDNCLDFIKYDFSFAVTERHWVGMGFKSRFGHPKNNSVIAKITICCYLRNYRTLEDLCFYSSCWGQGTILWGISYTFIYLYAGANQVLLTITRFLDTKYMYRLLQVET